MIDTDIHVLLIATYVAVVCNMVELYHAVHYNEHHIFCWSVLVTNIYEGVAKPW